MIGCMGAIWWGTRGTCPPLYQVGLLYAMSPHFFLFRVCIWRGFKNKSNVCHVLCKELFKLDGRLYIAKFMLKQSLVWHLKAEVFLYAFEESVDCHLLSSFCDDSNLHISLFKYVLSTTGVSKESISIDSLLTPIVESTYLKSLVWYHWFC